jgi:hypothetical protein
VRTQLVQGFYAFMRSGVAGHRDVTGVLRHERARWPYWLSDTPAAALESLERLSAISGRRNLTRARPSLCTMFRSIGQNVQPECG